MRTTTLALAAAAAVSLTACGGTGNEPATQPAAEPAAAQGSPTAAPSAAAEAGAAADGYTAGSDVEPHAAIGQDVAAVRALLAPAKEGGQVDWAAVGTLFTEGSGASKKGDGSTRTIRGLSPDSVAVPVVEAAVAGTDASLSDAARAQMVDKGIVVILTEKVLSELADAAEKVAAGQTDADKGAPHDVDEAFAFFVAEEQGPALTATKREKDDLTGKVRAPVVAALVDAQAAAAAGDAEALETATADVRSALDFVFYLAVRHYLDHEGDQAKQAEGRTFYLGIQDRVAAAAPEADAAVLATLAGDADAGTGRAALDSPEVFAALGLTDAQRVS